MDGWKTSFPLGRPIFRGYVSFREGKFNHPSLELPKNSRIEIMIFLSSEPPKMWVVVVVGAVFLGDYFLSEHVGVRLTFDLESSEMIMAAMAGICWT